MNSKYNNTQQAASLHSWQPDPNGLEQILQVLRNANSPNTQVQQQVQRAILQFQTIPEFSQYLMYILTREPSGADQQHEMAAVRAIAGLLLKNHLKTSLRNQKLKAVDKQQNITGLDYIKQMCLKSLGDQVSLVRNTLGSIITTIIEIDGISSWPECVPYLVECIANPGNSAFKQEGALSALKNILEDSGPAIFDAGASTRLEDDQAGGLIAPVLMANLGSSVAKIRQDCLHCFNLMICYMSANAINRLPDYMNALSRLASDQDSEVRKLVCSAFVGLLEVQPGFLMTSSQGIACLNQSVAQFMLQALLTDPETQVRLEACEFWLELCERAEPSSASNPNSNEYWQALRGNSESNSLLPSLVEALLKSMVYSEEELMMMGADDDDGDGDDEESNIKPRFHQTSASGASFGQSASAKQHSNSQNETNDNENSDDEDDEDDDLSEEWTVRKCAAACLDQLAVDFGTDILHLMIPHIQPYLMGSNVSGDNWQLQEMSVLALGAVADGCLSEEEASVGYQKTIQLLRPSEFLVPKLVELMSEHPKPLVRQISSWTLGRYSRVLMTAGAPENQQAQMIMQALQKMMLDRRPSGRRCQEAACSLLAVLAEERPELLMMAIGGLPTTIARCLSDYGTRNFLSLIDAVTALADQHGLLFGSMDIESSAALFCQLVAGHWLTTLSTVMLSAASSTMVVSQETKLLALTDCIISIMESASSNNTETAANWCFWPPAPPGNQQQQQLSFNSVCALIIYSMQAIQQSIPSSESLMNIQIALIDLMSACFVWFGKNNGGDILSQPDLYQKYLNQEMFVQPQLQTSAAKLSIPVMHQTQFPLSNTNQASNRPLGTQVLENVVLPALQQQPTSSAADEEEYMMILTEWRQSLFALIGDLSWSLISIPSASYQQLQQIFSGEFLKNSTENAVADIIKSGTDSFSDQTRLNCLNNAVWAMGQLVAQSAASSQQVFTPQFLMESMEYFCKLYSQLNQSSSAHQILMENLAIAIGRILLVEEDAAAVAALVPSFLMSMLGEDATEEKLQALTGFIRLVLRHSRQDRNCQQKMLEMSVHWLQSSQQARTTRQQLANASLGLVSEERQRGTQPGQQLIEIENFLKQNL